MVNTQWMDINRCLHRIRTHLPCAIAWILGTSHMALLICFDFTVGSGCLVYSRCLMEWIGDILWKKNFQRNVKMHPVSENWECAGFYNGTWGWREGKTCHSYETVFKILLTLLVFLICFVRGYPLFCYLCSSLSQLTKLSWTGCRGNIFLSSPLKVLRNVISVFPTKRSSFST